jgi:hypothetical protein
MASTPNDSWFYLAGERPIGPMSAEQLQAAISAGVVRRETMVHNAAWTGWCQAGMVPGLFPPTPDIPEANVVPSSPPAPEPPAPFSFQPAPSSSPRRGPEVKGRKKSASWTSLLLLLGTLAVGVMAAVALWSVVSRPKPLAKRPVAQAPTDQEDDEEEERTRKRRRRVKESQEDNGAFPNLQQGRDLEAGYDRKTFEILEPPTPQGKIDELVFAKWKQLGIEPANRCSDAVFLRRVYLDVIGTLPTADEARAFLTDKSPDKRKKLVDALLERPEFADYWAMKWCDLLRVKAEFPINLWPAAAVAYHRWIRQSIRDNMPYDKFVRKLLTSSGSNFRVAPVNFYRALQSKNPKGIAQAVALTFMGTRTDKWPPERLAGMSAFFLKIGYKPTGEWKEEIVIFDPLKTSTPPPAAKPAPKTAAERRAERRAAENKPKPEPPPEPMFPDGTPAKLEWDKDPREVFADWLITPQNPWFTRHIVNRVWCWLQGRGIVHEPDDIRPDNPPSNPELLNWLGEELVKANYDLKHIYRLILNSSTYQLSSLPKSKKPEAALQFASYTVRRLEAEVVIDALNQITGTTESYSSIIPEPYTFIPETCRAIALPDGSITSSFLELFGRPPRDSGMEAERNNRITAGQRLHMLNSSHIRNKLRDGPALKKLLEGEKSTENLFLAILSRFPAEGEGGGGETLAWTLINSTEFLFRH